MNSNHLEVDGGKALAEGLRGNSVITELNIADNNLAYYGEDMSGIIILANVIKDMGAISSVNLLKNDMGTDQAQALVSILKEHPSLKSLCGNKGDETELDMSGKMKGAVDAIMLVPEIIDNGALLVLNLASNNLFAEGIELLAEALKGNQIMTELNVSDNAATWDGKKHREMSGVIALADAIPDMRAMTSLNLANNFIGYGGNMDGIQALSSAGQVLAVILVPF
jgi:hypothetical protein